MRPRDSAFSPGVELQRQNAHADEIGAVNALEAFGDDGADAEQLGSLGGPVARGAGAVFFSGENDERHAALGVLDAGVEDGHLLAFREQARDAAFGAGRELVAQAHVGERAAHHDFVIAAARAVGVEVRGLHAMLG